MQYFFVALLFAFAFYGVIDFCKAISHAFKIKKSSEVVNVEDVKDKEDQSICFISLCCFVSLFSCFSS